MKGLHARLLSSIVAGWSALGAAQAPALRITSPGPDTLVNGPTRLEVVVTPDAGVVQSVRFFANGLLVCTVERPPFKCMWDAGPVVRGHHVRVVATLAGGRTLRDNLRTREPGFTAAVQTAAVLVQVIVKHRGQFVTGLTKQDFELFEDGAQQSIATLVSEEVPLDLVLAIDISGSMESSLDEVKTAVRQLLSKLRPGDATTLLGFNDTVFLAAERETDPEARSAAVDLLMSWGGTALYDATVQALAMVSREQGRKGVIIFSDGDDRHSLTGRDAAMARVQASEAMLYAVGFGAGATVPRLRSGLEEYARSTGGLAFFPQRTQELDGIFGTIISELSHQYVLSYTSTNLAHDGSWRNIDVKVRKGSYDIRARRGYLAPGPVLAGR
ncbi:MAG TPA: VWA domain-containing protein [Vicinamibacterales bacterium]|nr:VWA domain-containing protein [Vicinamibacterales bacterium]